jgi:hypothetical protein
VRRLVLAFLLGAVILPAGARAAYAPVDHPGPALDVPPAKLAAALQCTAGIDHDARAPVLLVPGSGATPKDNYSWNYEPALNARHVPWCAVWLPDSANNDIQVAGEYLVYSIRTLYQRAGRPIAIIGHSQGGMVPRWALRFWPDTRPMVDDLVGIAPSNHGSSLPQYTCRDGCSPADWQQDNRSNFIRALNSFQETFPGISYTVISSHFDEEDTPDGAADLHGGGGMITNVHVQDVCPNDTSEHLGLGTYDPVAYALAIDALEHPGPADPSRIPRSVCLTQFMPGVDPVTFPTDSAQAAIDVETSSSPTLYAEPPLACYVTLSCPAGAGSGPAIGGGPSNRCIDARYWTFRVHAGSARVVEAVIFVNGRRAARVRGHRLRTVTLPPLARGDYVVRIVTRASDGSRRVSVRRYRGCAKSRPTTRRLRGQRVS